MQGIIYPCFLIAITAEMLILFTSGTDADVVVCLNFVTGSGDNAVAVTQLGEEGAALLLGHVPHLSRITVPNGFGGALARVCGINNLSLGP